MSSEISLLSNQSYSTETSLSTTPLSTPPPLKKRSSSIKEIENANRLLYKNEKEGTQKIHRALKPDQKSKSLPLLFKKTDPDKEGNAFLTNFNNPVTAVKSNEQIYLSSTEIAEKLEKFSAEIAKTSNIDKQEKLQTEKKLYLEEIVKRLTIINNQVCISPNKKNSQAFKEKLNELEKRLVILIEHSKLIKIESYLLDLQSQVKLTFSRYASECDNIHEAMLLANLKTVIGVFESEVLLCYCEEEKKYKDQYSELSQILNVIKNKKAANSTTNYLSNPYSSFNFIPAKKRRSSLSENNDDKELFDSIVKKLKDCVPLCAQNKLLILTALSEIENNEWAKNTLFRDFKKFCISTKLEITSKLPESFNCYSLQTSENDKNMNFWNLLLDPQPESTFQKEFLLVYRNVIDNLYTEPGYPSVKLFKLFNHKFVTAGPYQRTQMLSIASVFLSNSVLNLTVPGKDEKEFEIVTLEIQKLIKQAKDTRSIPLKSMAQKLEDLWQQKLPLQLPQQPEAPTFKAAFESISKGVDENTYKNLVLSFSQAFKATSLYHFLQINSTEWAKDMNGDNAPHINALIELGIDHRLWIEETLCSQPDTLSLTRTIEFFIDVMMELTNENTSSSSSPIDYNSAMSIYSVLSKMHIQSLFYSFSPKLKISKDHSDNYTIITKLFNSEKRYFALRKKILSMPFCIPDMSTMINNLKISLKRRYCPLLSNERLEQVIIQLAKVPMKISKMQSNLIYRSEKMQFNFKEEISRIHGYFLYRNNNGFDRPRFEKALKTRMSYLTLASRPVQMTISIV